MRGLFLVLTLAAIALPATEAWGQTGACCGILDGVCTDGVDESTCINSIFGTYQGDDTTCAGVECPPIGACCDPTYGTCVRTTTQMLCEYYWGRTWLGEGTTCDGENPCPQPPKGACCMQDGSCEPDMMVDDCTYYEGVYQGDDSTCETVSCPQPAIGACCFPSGGCLVVAEYLCEDNFGTFQGDGTICWPDNCSTGEPPTNGWSDNFDSYDNGTFLNHVGGWWGWDDNPAGAGTVSNVQAHSAPHSIMVNDTADAVHPFSPAFSGGQWIMTCWQYIPSDLSGMTYFVINSYYEDGGTHYWSLEMHFDPATGMVTDSTRDPSGTSPLPIVYDQWVELRFEIDFDTSAGTISEYYNGQLLITGDYIAGAIGQLALANIDLYAPHSTPVYYDDFSIVVDEGGSGVPSNPMRPLFAGLSSPSVMTHSTNLDGYPDVTWYGNGYQFQVDGAAGLPDGTLYLTSAENFSTTSGELYIAPLQGPAIFKCDMDNNVSGLAYGGGRLFGFCNYATPKGIYEIDPETGHTTLLVDTGGKLYFALDYNPVDGLLYGYNEYGAPTGLDSINVDTGEILHVASPVPAANSACRGLACGYNKVYAMTVYGIDYPMYVYDLSQGTMGTWEAMAHPYPDTQGGGGMAWIPGVVTGDTNCDGAVDELDIPGFVQALVDADAYTTANPDCIIWNADINEDGVQNGLDIAAFVELMLN